MAFRDFEEALSLRCRAAMLLNEAEMHMWFARGCPADRSGVLGVSLLGTRKQVRAAIAKATNENTR